MPAQPESCKNESRCVSAGQRKSLRVRGLVYWFLLTLVCGSATKLFAAGQAGTVEGYVRTVAGQKIPAAKLILSSDPARILVSTRTDPSGHYRLTAPPGTYRIEVTQQGYATASRSGVDVENRSILRVNFVLKSSSPTGAQKSPVPSLSAIHFYVPFELKTGQLADPVAGGGYSNSAAARSAEMINVYLSSPGSRQTAVQPVKRQQDNSVPLAHLQQAADQEPTEANLQRWGSALLETRKYSLAAEAFQQGVAKYPNSGRLWAGLGISLYSQGRYHRAVQALIRAAQCGPVSPQVYDFLEEAYRFDSRTDGTVAGLLERFIRLEPRNAHAHYDYAMILWRTPLAQQTLGLLDDVESELKKAVSLDPGFADAHFRLGVLYDREKMIPLALAQYQAAIGLQPDFTQAHYRLAQDYLRAGDRARATSEFGIYEKLAARAENQ
jgi:tetratricopeptide (TPR) repeat protein